MKISEMRTEVIKNSVEKQKALDNCEVNQKESCDKQRYINKFNLNEKKKKFRELSHELLSFFVSVLINGH